MKVTVNAHNIQIGLWSFPFNSIYVSAADTDKVVVYTVGTNRPVVDDVWTNFTNSSGLPYSSRDALITDLNSSFVTPGGSGGGGGGGTWGSITGTLSAQADLQSALDAKITASGYVGQSSITTLGTIATGVWNGTAIANANLANSTITVNSTSTSLGGSVTITVTGTSNRVTVSGGTGLTPTIDISASYVGQSSITTLGTVTTGTLGSGAKVLLGSDATGDIYYNGGSGVLTRLAAGAAGTFLMFNGTGAAPIVSTLILPNSITSNYIPYTISTNTIGSSSNFQFTGTQVGIGTAPASMGFASRLNILSSGGGAVSSGISVQQSGTTDCLAMIFAISDGTLKSLWGMSGLNDGINTGSVKGDLCIRGQGTAFLISTNSGTSPAIYVKANSLATGFGNQTSPTALIHAAAGTATASTAPLKLTSGTNLTTAEAGAFEYNGTNLFFTRTGTTRESVICSNAVNSVSPTVPDRTITVVIAGTTYYLSAKTTND